MPDFNTRRELRGFFADDGDYPDASSEKLLNQRPPQYTRCACHCYGHCNRGLTKGRSNAFR